MRVELGAKVVTADGDEIGTIDKLIVDPDSGAVRTLVVRKGLLFSKDVEVPLDGLAAQRDGVAQLRYTRAEVNRLHEFLEGSYTTLPPDQSASYEASGWYPPSSLIFPSRWDGPIRGEPYGHEAVGAVGDEVAARHLAQELENAVVKAGSDVRSRDGEKLGEVHRLVFDASTGRPTMLVIRKGFLFTSDVEVPAGLISSVADDVVYLDARRDEIDRHTRTVLL